MMQYKPDNDLFSFHKFFFKVHEHNFECKIQVQFFLLDACRSNFFKSLGRKKIDIYFYLLWGAKEFFYTHIIIT